MVVVGAVAEETGTGITCHDLQPENILIKRIRLRQCADLKMNMADCRAFGGLPEWGFAGALIECLEIEPLRCHLHRSVGLVVPLIRLPVAIDLDAVSFRIGQIDRLADEVIRRTLKPDIVMRNMR